jgi:hypothetical protein
MLIADSPNPGKYSMLNWPGKKAYSPGELRIVRSRYVATPGVSGTISSTVASLGSQAD